MSNTVTLIGIDPGYDRLGWAVGKVVQGKLIVVEYGCIVTNKKAPHSQRYVQIIQDFQAILQKHQPDEAALETLFFSKNQTTALAVSEARGVIISCLLLHHCTYAEYNPNQIKLSVTGYGKADKQAVEKMVRLQLGIQSTEKILDDTMDALGILLTHSVSRNSRL